MTEGGLPTAEAAARLGISERTLRERIKAGKIAATKVIDRGNAAYRVFLDAPPAATPAPPLTPVIAPPVTEAAPPAPDPSLSEFLAFLREKDQTILELAGRCGWLQAQLQAAHERIALLEAPKAQGCANGEEHLCQMPELAHSTNAEGAGDHLREKPEAAKPANAETAHRSGPEQNRPTSASSNAQPRPWWRRLLPPGRSSRVLGSSRRTGPS